MRIQHNIMSMNAYRNYNNNTSALSKNLEKLSSGYKINRAGDDAAGLAISEKMRAQITGLNQAQANAKSGINLVQTAEGAMQEVQDMLNRMVKLADQSANGTFDDTTDRANLQKEVEQLKSEINRIADSANFNGIKLLDGSMDAQGVIGGEAMDISFNKLSAYSASVSGAKPTFTVNLDGFAMKATAANGTVALQIGGQTVTFKFTGATTGDLIKASNLKVTAGQTITLGGITFKATAATGALTFKTTMALTSGMTLNPAYEVEVTGQSGGTVVAGMVNSGTQVIQEGKLDKAAQQAVANFEVTLDMLQQGASIKIGDQTFTFNYSAKSNVGTVIGVKDLLNDEGKLTADKIKDVVSRITKAGGNNANFTIGNNGANMLTIQSKQGQASSVTNKLDTLEELKKEITVTTPQKNGTALSLQIGDTSDSFNQLSLSIKSVKTKSLGIDKVDIGKQTSAQAAVDTIKAAINTVSSIRGDLGATQNRLDHTINNLSVMAENIQDAESTVRDTDVAEEMMAYTKNNILVQSAQAMLAQANQVPQGVLQLLQ